jgi:hypothetical protein
MELIRGTLETGRRPRKGQLQARDKEFIGKVMMEGHFI